MTDRERFDRIRASWVKVQARRQAFREQMWERYRKHDAPYSWRTRTENAKWDAIMNAETRCMDRMCDLLDEISPRDWRNGVPCNWLMSELTFEDATTRGAMSVIPPTTYGYCSSDSERFAQAIAA